MNKFKINISSEFEENKPKIYKKTELTLKKLVKIINVEDFQIYIKPFSSDNPYLKISAAADEPHIMWLKLNTSNPDFKAIIDKYLAEGIAHEFHHIARMDSKKDWNFLELLVMEGLAIHFVMEVFKIKKPLYVSEISNEDIEIFRSKIITDLFDENFNIRFWQKREKKQNSVPRSFIYRLGYRIVEEYLRDHPEKDAVILYKEPAKSFMPEYLI
ncbi:MAG: DUF2268 domain-containing putative Zn-dependent protease [Candidatus Cloacimonadota bacterium]|nr:DUF2268 domain-containing putative Zn-dependent protease [Candidatus Cloacimonadota bacterium]